MLNFCVDKIKTLIDIIVRNNRCEETDLEPLEMRISQQTFDEAVASNISDLGMEPEEAVSEAITEFRAQGIDLDNITTEYFSEDQAESIKREVNKLTSLDTPEDVINQLQVLKKECDKGIQYKVAAGKHEGYKILLDVYRKFNDIEVKKNCLKTMLSLMTKQPDLLDEAGCQLFLDNLNKDVDVEIQKLTLKCCKECCIMHEINRQTLFNLNIVPKLKELLAGENTEILRDVLGVARGLILDDDIRVEFGKAHEHARIIANEFLHLLIDLLKKFRNNETVVNDIMLTLSSLLVRHEFCRQVEELGGLETILEVTANCVKNEKVARQCFKLLKALAGNDDVKAHIIQKGFAPIICNSLEIHKTSTITSTAGLGCVASLSLRCPSNSNAFFEAGAPDLIVELMKMHPNDKALQKSASWAIRNMVSRSRNQNPRFLELGVEDLLKRNLTVFKDFEYDTKAALRDLDCKVQLKEEWTGKGGKITTSSLLEN